MSAIISLSRDDMLENVWVSSPISSLYTTSALTEKLPSASSLATSTTPPIGFKYFIVSLRLIITMHARVTSDMATISRTRITVLRDKSAFERALAAHQVCPQALIGE